MKKIILFVFIFLFYGCSSGVAVGSLNDEILAYTSKFQNDNPKILVIGTYLNPIYKSAIDNNKSEVILLNLYPKNLQIKNVTINGQNASFRLLDEDQNISKLGNLDIFWGSKFEIKSSEKSSPKLNLKLTLIDENDRLVQASLDFQKIAKSLYWISK